MAKKLNIRDRYAYDMDSSKGEVWDIDCINKSIENILTTSYGERIFNLGFGSPLNFSLFEGMTNIQGEKLINDVIDALKRWEDRITIIENDVRLYSNSDNSFSLSIPYRINKNNITSTFKKKIII